MTLLRREYAVPAAVYLGAVILITFPATMVLTALGSAGLEALGVDHHLAHGLVLAASFLIALQLAVEAAALQLGGVEALHRGSRRQAIVRHAAFAGGAFLVLAFVTVVGLGTAAAEFGPPAAVLGGLLALAGGWALVRGGRSFLAGYRSGANPR
ncbi:hypothetical protein [Halovivax sp.]|uniref:hypothetical protein n=1 Tax=Halovivax sp. TaxID=1935978 RepID=UPI0025C19171|nr:hypothetical protein [Halovivax sp.]